MVQSKATGCRDPFTEINTAFKRAVRNNATVHVTVRMSDLVALLLQNIGPGGAELLHF